jgi:hypothetical protein
MYVSSIEGDSALAAPLHCAQRPGGRERDKGGKEREGCDTHIDDSESRGDDSGEGD